jgi:diguanylate cyclase (GGDEF)-like protein
MRQILPLVKGDKKLTLTVYLTFIGFVFLTAFGFISWHNDNPATSITLFSAVFLGVINLYLIKTKYRDLTRYILSLIVAFMGLSLLAFGGQDGTGYLWTFPLLAMALAVLSVREGALFSALYLLCTFCLLFIPVDVPSRIDYHTVTATRYFLSAFALCSITLVLVNIQENTNRQLHLKTVKDDLTGLFNRAVLNDTTVDRINHTRNEHDNYLLLIDIDHFKKINDNFGHNTGDQVLMILGDILNSSMRDNDLAIRWGGEEFLVVLQSCPGKHAEKIANNIRNKFEQDERIIKLLQQPVTLSVGISATSYNLVFDKALSLADTRLYKAKAQGRNRVVSHDD